MNGIRHNQDLSRSAFRFALISGALQDFAAQIIASAAKGTPLNDELLAVIKTTCIRNLKNNSSLEGLGIGEEVAFLQQAVVDLERAMDRAIALGRGV